MLLTKSYTPNDIVETINGAKYALNFLGLFHFEETEGYKTIFHGVYFELSNPIFEKLDIKSESAIYNIFPMIFLTFLITLSFMFSRLLYWIFSK